MSDETHEECSVGIYWEWSDTTLVGWSEVFSKMARTTRMLRDARGKAYSSYVQQIHHAIGEARIDWFNFCPYCGKEIDPKMKAHHDAKLQALKDGAKP